jgi:TldD protein
LEERLDLLRRAERAARDRLGREGTVACQWGDWQGERRVRTADGVQARAELVLSSIQVVVSVREAGQVHGDKASVGGALGLEAYEGERSPEALGKLAAERCLDAARARKAPAGSTPAVVDPALGGILAHESFGHLTEGDVVRSGYSLLRGKLGERLGSAAATVVDEGLAEPGQGVEVPFDDEGTPARSVTVLEQGVLRSWLHARGTAALDGVEPTGNARAVDIRYPPICRMRNTSFAPGDLTFEEALQELGSGVYACESLGGMPRSDGNFLFHAQRGWRVEKGELREPLKGVSLSGHILSFLGNIRGATRERKLDSFFFGGCGKWDQNGLAIGFGGPHLLLREVFMGGEGG